jgi:hypothetical protein
MRFVIACAALSVCGSAQAATYVYQANAYQGHNGRCGAKLLPFQVTMTLQAPLPLNTTTANASLKTLSVYAGERNQWHQRFTKNNSHQANFTTDQAGTITQWVLGGAKGLHEGFSSDNETNDVRDTINFKCGGAGVDNDPGVWTRTE